MFEKQAKNNMKTDKITIFENREVRKNWHNGEWFFAIADVVLIFTDSKQPGGYIKDMRRREGELNKGWGQIATPQST